MTSDVSKGLRASEIKEIIDRVLGFLKVNFLGVFSRDKLPKISRRTRFPACLVVNSAPASQAGEHWLAIYFLDSIHCEFFDSYAYHPGFYGLSEYLAKFSVTATVDHTLQSLESAVCGHYCILYLYLRSLAYPLSTIVSSFSRTDLILNDHRAADFVKHSLTLSRSPMQTSKCSCPTLCCLSRTALLCNCILLRKLD